MGSNYVDLKINGRLFPLWLMSNFKKYKLDEIVLDANIDPCNVNQTQNYFRKYQIFLTKYLDFNSPYQDILIYHGLGSGKTGTAINIYNMLYNYSPEWNVFILLKATLKKDPWMKELEKWLDETDKKNRENNIVFIAYDSPIADKQFIDAVKKSDTTKKTLYIIEEAHNFISNVYSNIVMNKGKRAQTIYDYIIQDKKENNKTRVILLSGTPVINNPFEFGLLFNLLRPGLFPKNEQQFNNFFVTDQSIPVINPAHINNFQRRILGLVSYYSGATPDLFAEQKIHYVNTVMSNYQKDIYNYFENIEDKIATKGKSKTYKSYTRQACNFVFPFLKQGYSGETRPRPSKFKISEKMISDLNKGKLKTEEKNININKYIEVSNEFVKEFNKYLNEKHQNDIDNNYTYLDDIKLYQEHYGNDYNNFINSAKKSKLINAMYECSSKMLQIIFLILISPGPVLVYSNYVIMEGLEIFKIYLEHLGFSKFEKNRENTYIEYHGGLNFEERSNNITLFNDPENKYGKIIKIILLSSAGAEGLSLKNVRQVHIMESYWHEVRITQIIGRAIRQCYHKDLPINKRHVDIYRHKSIRSNKKITTDEFIEQLAKEKTILLDSFLKIIKEAAVDCQLNKNHNNLRENINCFQFEESVYFDKQIAPAYKTDLYDDDWISNGSNVLNINITKIKVIKIVAVKLLGNEKKSDKENYWFNPKTKFVYDFDLQFPIGKIMVDDKNHPIKLDDTTYIIDKVIPIPVLT